MNVIFKRIVAGVVGISLLAANVVSANAQEANDPQYFQKFCTVNQPDCEAMIHGTDSYDPAGGEILLGLALIAGAYYLENSARTNAQRQEIDYSRTIYIPSRNIGVFADIGRASGRIGRLRSGEDEFRVLECRMKFNGNQGRENKWCRIESARVSGWIRAAAAGL